MQNSLCSVYHTSLLVWCAVRTPCQHLQLLSLPHDAPCGPLRCCQIGPHCPAHDLLSSWSLSSPALALWQTTFSAPLHPWTWFNYLPPNRGPLLLSVARAVEKGHALLHSHPGGSKELLHTSLQHSTHGPLKAGPISSLASPASDLTKSKDLTNVCSLDTWTGDSSILD